MAAYDAFISYSHALDKPIAGALQTVVQKLGKPWYRRRALRLFRDDTSLSATPHLWPTIEAALAQSRFLILLASPEAAASPWVGKEIEYWLAHKSIDTLLIALTDGALTWDNDARDFVWSASTPLPGALKGRFASEPRWVDISAYRSGAAPRDVRFMDLGADFAAAIHGLPKEDLLSLEVRQQRRALTLAWSAAGSLLVLAGLAGWQWQAATAQRKRAENALTTAAATSDQLVYDLALKLRDRRGMPVDLVREILGRVEGLQRQLAQGGETSPENRRLEGTALGELSTTLREQGYGSDALKFAERARAISEAFVASDPGNAKYQRDLAVDITKTGDAKVAIGQPIQALDDFRKSLAIVQALASADPDNANLQRDIMIGLTRVGGILAASGKPADALDPFRKAVSILEALASKEPANPLWQADLSSAYSRIGLALSEGGRSAEALAAHRQSLDLRERLAAAEPNNTQRQYDVYLSQTRIGDLVANTGRPDQALPAYRGAQIAIERLALSDAGNLKWQSDLAIAYDHSGDMLLVAGNAEQALQEFQKSLTIRQKLVAISPEHTEWQHELAVSYDKAGDALSKGNRKDDALKSYQSGLAISQKLLDAEDDNPDWQRTVAVALLKIGDAVAGQDSAQTRDNYQHSLAIRSRLADRDPTNWQRQRDVALVEERLGNLHAADGRPQDAADMLRKAFAVRERIAEADPDNTVWQRELWISAVRLAAFYKDAKDIEESLAWFREGLAVGERAAAKHPDDPWWPLRLAGIEQELGSLLITEKRPTEALAPLRKNAIIRGELSVGDPASALLQRNFAISKGLMALALADLGRRDEAVAGYREALAIIEVYAAGAPGEVTYQLDLTEYLVRLALLGDQPRERYQRTIAILRPLGEGGKLTAEQMMWIPNIEKAIAALPN